MTEHLPLIAAVAAGANALLLLVAVVSLSSIAGELKKIREMLERRLKAGD